MTSVIRIHIIKENLFFLLVFLCFPVTLFAQNGSVTNIQASQRTDGSGIVDIYYDLAGTASVFYINVEVSLNNGSTFSPVSLTNLTGINNVTPGTNKHITWNALLSNNNTFSPQTKLKLIANTCVPCGQSITINHQMGLVSPVNKTTTYETVAHIPGEPAKCWITSNLGSDHQATSVDDATEPSAGWYWQFNRKQGYKHDGINRTPNTVWISSISENSDWIPDNDPCVHEIGTGWRVPSKSEWENVDVSGNWSTWNDSWNSGLKLHAAGLLGNNGSLFNRGSYGGYWTNLQSSSSHSWHMAFGSSYSYISNNVKEYGWSIRCLKDELNSTGQICPGVPNIVYGGQTYNTVQVGTQCWLKENLNIGTKINGTLEQTNNNLIEKYCYNDLESNCEVYGGLYQWDEAMQYLTTAGTQGICPQGWHVPTDTEWATLFTGLGGLAQAGGKMKSTGTIEGGTGLWHYPNIEATNESGFTAVPSGCLFSIGSFSGLAYVWFCWSSSEDNPGSAWAYKLDSGNGHVYRWDGYKYDRFSVRCIKD